jgi:SpoVK/Ycf46/Vps4 family AAA+-type ATPase
MVRASKHGKRKDANPALKRDDIIASKGNGLIILLHGGPGTGKTLTAGEFCVHSD